MHTEVDRGRAHAICTRRPRTTHETCSSKPGVYENHLASTPTTRITYIHSSYDPPFDVILLSRRRKSKTPTHAVLIAHTSASAHSKGICTLYNSCHRSNTHKHISHSLQFKNSQISLFTVCYHRLGARHRTQRTQFWHCDRHDDAVRCALIRRIFMMCDICVCYSGTSWTISNVTVFDRFFSRWNGKRCNSRSFDRPSCWFVFPRSPLIQIIF